MLIETRSYFRTHVASFITFLTIFSILVYDEFLQIQGSAGPCSSATVNNYCTAPAGTGCFRAYVKNVGGNITMAFCGDKTLTHGAQDLQAVVTMASDPTVVSIGSCSSSNLQSTGVCYCDNADKCNAVNSASVGPNCHCLYGMISAIVGFFWILQVRSISY